MCTVLLLSTAIACHAVRASSITVANQIINTTDERFVSFTIDSSKFVDGSNPSVNLSDPQLLYLAQQLAPSYLRVGGTASDYTYYQVGDEDPCHLPSSSYHCLPMPVMQQIIDFAVNVGAKLIFGLSMGYPTYPDDNTTVWNSSNTRQFLQYLKGKGYDNSKLYGFELGNEMNNDPFPTPTVQSNAFKSLKQIVDDIWGNSNNIQLLGPDPHSYILRESDAKFDYIPEFVEETCSVLDGVTYHSYVNVNQSALLTPNGLNEQYRESVRVSDIWNDAYFKNASAHCRDLVHRIFAGEIAEHNTGGVPNVTNTFYDGFWYLDALGTISDLGHAGFFRQQLAKSEYGLLDYNYNPNCDYFTAYLFNQLMSNKVVRVKSDDENLRVYAHCSRNSTTNGVSLAYINLNEKETEIQYDATVVGKANVFLYALTPGDNSQGLQSDTMALNGKVLKLENGKLPSMNGEQISNGVAIKVQGYSYGFVSFESTTLSVCSSTQSVVP
mmetsp:Transcript_67853/g.107674  ORF Transcript_67853/g.107674 Transcript_67853/m.107674 type:complete len:496 (+) Transcript_67853:33-1520(+)